jgi:hypothetical protein
VLTGGWLALIDDFVWTYVQVWFLYGQTRHLEYFDDKITIVECSERYSWIFPQIVKSVCLKGYNSAFNLDHHSMNVTYKGTHEFSLFLYFNGARLPKYSKRVWSLVEKSFLEEERRAHLRITNYICINLAHLKMMFFHGGGNGCTLYLVCNLLTFSWASLSDSSTIVYTPLSFLVIYYTLRIRGKWS